MGKVSLLHWKGYPSEETRLETPWLLFAAGHCDLFPQPFCTSVQHPLLMSSAMSLCPPWKSIFLFEATLQQKRLMSRHSLLTLQSFMTKTVPHPSSSLRENWRFSDCTSLEWKQSCSRIFWGDFPPPFSQLSPQRSSETCRSAHSLWAHHSLSNGMMTFAGFAHNSFPTDF